MAKQPTVELPPNTAPDPRQAKGIYAEFEALGLTAHQMAFLCAYIEGCGRIFGAANAVGMNASGHYHWLKDFPVYAEAFELAKRYAADNLLDHATRRAADGVDEIIFFKGEPCGVKTNYSDRLMALLLKGEFPEKYADRNISRIGNLANEVLKLDPGRDKLSDTQIDEFLEKAAQLEVMLKTQAIENKK